PILRRAPTASLFPYTTLFRSKAPRWATRQKAERVELKAARLAALYLLRDELGSTPKTHLAEALGISRWTYDRLLASLPAVDANIDRKSTRLNSSHVKISYAVF